MERFIDRFTATHKALALIVITVVATWSTRGCYQDVVMLPERSSQMEIDIAAIRADLQEIKGNRFTSQNGEALRTQLQELTLQLVAMQQQMVGLAGDVSENHTRVERLEAVHGFRNGTLGGGP